MNEPRDGKSDALDYLYREYVRLSDRCTSYVQSSFDDIRWYGAIGAVAAWAPISDSRLFTEAGKPVVMLFGFLAILIVFIVLALYNALKQSLVVYYLRELGPYEQELRKRLGADEQLPFRWTETYAIWRNTEVKRVSGHLFLVIVLTLVVFPTVVLLTRERAFAWMYLAAALTLFGVYLSAARIIFRAPTPNPKRG